MIIHHKPKSWLRMLFAYQGTALQRIWARLIMTVLLATVITYIDLGQKGRWAFHDDLTPLPFSLVGLALGIFLGFRNNTSYDRFWEGRKLWGRVVNTSRSLTRQILTMIGPIQKEWDGRLTDGMRSHYYGELPSQTERQEEPDVDELLAFHKEMVHRLAAYVHCLRLHLRDQTDEPPRGLLHHKEVVLLEGESNRPVAILQTLGDRFREAWLRGWIHSQHFVVLERGLTELTDIQGGCERIKSTPIPFSYTALIHKIVAIYCYALPFGIVNATGWFTPVVVGIIAYAFFGLDAVGDEIEDPFGEDLNDLPLLTLSTMIEVNIRQRIGDSDLPELLQPKNNVLR